MERIHFQMNNKILLIVLLLGALRSTAQKFPEHEDETARNKGNGILLHFSVGGQLPGGDLANRFGSNGLAGGGAEFITRSNFLIGAESFFLFGNTVKEDPLAILRTPEGDLIGKDQLLADVALRERGLYIGGSIGKMFTFNAYRDGLRLTLGAGWLQHKIRVQDNTQTLTQITGDYKKGYDRLTGGPALTQFIGWQHLSANRRANWIIGFDFSQGFTQSRRSWDFSSIGPLRENRLDLRFGIRAAWILPFYFGGADKVFY